MAKKLSNLNFLIRRGTRQRRSILDARAVAGRVWLPPNVVAALDSADETKTDLDAVVELLGTPGREERTTIARCIEELSNAWDRKSRFTCISATESRLQSALEDEYPEVQRHVLRALAKFHFVQADIALPLLVKKLRSPIAEIQQAALLAIQSYGRDLASPFSNEIAALLESQTTELQVQVCRTLASFSTAADSAICPLLACVQAATDSHVRSEVVKSLMAIDPLGAVLSRKTTVAQRELLVFELRRMGASGRNFRQLLQAAWTAADSDNSESANWYTTKSLADLLDVEVRTITRWLSDGTLLHKDRKRGKCLVEQSTIEGLQAERRKK